MLKQISLLLLLLFFVISCGTSNTVQLSGAAKLEVSLDTSNLTAYFLRYCCMTYLNNGQAPTTTVTVSSTPDVDACVNNPPTQGVIDCSSNQTASLISFLNQLATP